MSSLPSLFFFLADSHIQYLQAIYPFSSISLVELQTEILGVSDTVPHTVSQTLSSPACTLPSHEDLSPTLTLSHTSAFVSPTTIDRPNHKPSRQPPPDYFTRLHASSESTKRLASIFFCRQTRRGCFADWVRVGVDHAFTPLIPLLFGLLCLSLKDQRAEYETQYRQRSEGCNLVSSFPTCLCRHGGPTIEITATRRTRARNRELGR